MYLTSTSVPSIPTKPVNSTTTLRSSNSLLGRPLPSIPTTETQLNNNFQRDLRQSERQQQQQHFEPRKSSNMQIYSSQRPIIMTTLSTQQKHKASWLEQLSVERVSDFAAQMSCYLWFSDTSDPYLLSSPATTPGGNKQQRYSDFRPRDAFKKFSRDVVSATQVSHSVILLSLLYIYRMKSNNPSIQGHPGSEYRTFTVALMLANKFLDDNTYTNKTWSEVTNIPVREINIMEIEFLGSLNFSLYVSEQEYFNWLQTMYQFITLLNDDSINRDQNTQSDCGIAILKQQQQQQQQQYSSTVKPYQSTTAASTTPNSYKRSAKQAFVGSEMVTSPSKRANLYPVYTINTSQSQQPTPVTTYYLPVLNSSSNNINFTNSHKDDSYTVSQTTKFFFQNAQHQYALNMGGVFYATRQIPMSWICSN